MRTGQPARIDYSQFLTEVKSGNVESVTFKGETIEGKKRSGDHFLTYSPETSNSALIGTLEAQQVKFSGEPPKQQSLFLQLLMSAFPILILIGFWAYFMRQMQGASGGRGAMSFGKSRARLLGEDQVNITFADVAGVEEAKQEVVEIVDFLKDPGKFQKLGGKIPKGVLMVGSPEPARRCWPGPSPAKPRCRFSPFRARISWKCSSASAPPACATCSSRPRSTRPASFSSTKSTRSAAIAAPAWAAVTTSASRR